VQSAPVDGGEGNNNAEVRRISRGDDLAIGL
jgi:hypothetical protein